MVPGMTFDFLPVKRWAVLKEVSAAVTAAVGKGALDLPASHAEAAGGVSTLSASAMAQIKSIIWTSLLPRQTANSRPRPNLANSRLTTVAALVFPPVATQNV